MDYIIQNDKIKITIDSFGAEPKSIQSKANGREYLWQGDEKIWSGRAPVLFPFIGRLKDKHYESDGKGYCMDIHGFASESNFSVMEQTESSIVFMLSSSANTFKIYPYQFDFQVKYELVGNSLKKTHTITNTGTNPMFYEVGGHDGYSLELHPETEQDQFYLRFENGNMLESYTTDEQVMIQREKKSLELNNQCLPLSKELFREDALILEKVPEASIYLGSKKLGEFINVTFSDFPYLGIWTKYVEQQGWTRYLCIEPWSALPDCNYLDYDIEHKIGISKLLPDEEEGKAYEIQFLQE